jgi:hypothetical protein
MAWISPSTVSVGSVLTASTWNQDVVANWQAFDSAWTSFTPTFSGGWALGNSTHDAKFLKIGRMVHFYAAITLGSSATKGTTLLAALPVAASSVNATTGVTAYFNDVGSGIFPAHIVLSSTSVIEITTVVTNQTYAQITGVQETVPFTWATGDAIYYSGTYEAAS